MSDAVDPQHTGAVPSVSVTSSVVASPVASLDVTSPAAAPLADGIDALVIGASAGGVDALCQLLPALPPNARAAVCIVLHLPRERPSLLVEVFGPHCRCPVLEACDKQVVEPGKVYIAPPDYHLLIDTGPKIALSFDEPLHFSRPSIDVLFESAADVFRERLAGMLLIVGLANIIMNRAQETEGALNAPKGAAETSVASDPLADIGVAPAASPSSANGSGKAGN